MSNKFKKAVLAAALAAVVGVSAGASACTVKTAHPRAKITFSFNEVEYEVDFTLYRNMYPQTVQHFIELADANYYDNMIIHDYKSSDWVTGGYTYSDEEETGYSAAYAGISGDSTDTMVDYLERNSKEAKYYELFEEGKLSASVYKSLSYNDKLEATVSAADAWATLIGEFSNNDHNIEKNALSATFGVLKMVYYSKGDANQQVAIKNSFGQVMEHDYKYNCATSLFALQVGSSSAYSSSSYCTFGKLTNDKAKEVLQSMQDAMADYLSELGSSKNFTTTVKTKVDTLDTFAEEGGRNVEVSFLVPSVPLLIKSVKITKH